jgi:hypothetical protein
VWVDSTDLSASPYVGIINPGDLLALPQAQKEGGIYVSTQGYAWAFSDPPHGLATHEVENLFREINQQLFGDDLAALTIYSWSTGWASYFDPDAEWWGSFLWTVYNTNTGGFVGIAAAATD